MAGRTMRLLGFAHGALTMLCVVPAGSQRPVCRLAGEGVGCCPGGTGRTGPAGFAQALPLLSRRGESGGGSQDPESTGPPRAPTGQTESTRRLRVAPAGRGRLDAARTTGEGFPGAATGPARV